MLLTKKEYRVRLRRDRDKISLPQKAVWDRKITETLLEDAEYQRAESLFLYASFGSDVDTWSILEQALVAGKQVALPRVEGKEIRFYSIKGRQDLQTGTWGIMEPRAHCRPAEQADLMIMPGLGFDEARHRLGYGGGYYLCRCLCAADLSLSACRSDRHAAGSYRDGGRNNLIETGGG